MNKPLLKRILSVFLVFSIIIIVNSCSNGTDNTANNNTSSDFERYNVPAGLVKKTETVYVNLNNSGKRYKTTVSDWLHADSAHVYVEDITNLDYVLNITDDSKPDQNGTNLTWYLSSNDLYYQGETNKELPLDFEITYFFNGVQCDPDSLIGKSGNIEINIRMINNKSKVYNFNGTNCTLFVPLIVVGGILLSEDKFSNISVVNGQVSGAGASQYATFVGFPGINDSLGLNVSSDSNNTFSFNDNFKIKAVVKNFELGNFMVAALPISSLNIGLNSVTDTIDSVKVNLSKLQSIQNTLNSMNLSQLISSLSSDTSKLSELSDLVEQASSLYDNNKALIDVLNKYTTPENIQTIQVLCDYISSFDDYDNLNNAINVINNYFGDDVDVEQLRNGLNLLQQLSNDLSNPQVKQSIDNLSDTLKTLKALQSAIDNNKDLINALKSLSKNDSLNSLNSLTAAVSGLEGNLALGGISGMLQLSGDTDVIASKMTAWLEYGKTYNIFTAKKDNVLSSVSFIYKVDGISKKAQTNNNDSLQPEENDEQKSGIKSFFDNLFNR